MNVDAIWQDIAVIPGSIVSSFVEGLESYKALVLLVGFVENQLFMLGKSCNLWGLFEKVAFDIGKQLPGAMSWEFSNDNYASSEVIPEKTNGRNAA